MQLIRTEALTKVYGDSAQPVRALSDVNFSVESGEFVAIMGPSGSDKSTLLYLLGGLERPSSGKVWLRDIELSTQKDDALSRLRRKELGIVFQFFNLIPVLTARENAALPLILDGVKRVDALKRADQVLDRLGLSDRADHRPSELSGGQQQRVALARALVTDPVLIMGDEPTGNLDTRSGEEIVQLLRRAVDDWKCTIVIVTHDPRIAAYADRIVFLKDGKVVDENRLQGRGDAEKIRAQFGKASL